MSWNRTYRPHRFSDLHLRRVREYGESLLKSERFPQAFLFTGPKGTGKTSTSRILGAVLNDPANEAAVRSLFFEKSKPAAPLQEPSDSPLTERILNGNSFVVHELDAASNRGIDDVRALRERVSLPPSEGVMSVYILDEVHMLTTEAFNALLKLLEEPPPHVVFVLATTEREKLPETIVSRCHVVQFTKASDDELVAALTNIAAQEQLTVDAAVLAAVASRADGSFRDAVKLLEMIVQVGGGSATQAAAESVLSLSLEASCAAACSALLAKDPAAVVKVFQTLRARGTDAKQLHKALLLHLYSDLMQALGVEPGTATYPAATTTFLLKELSSSELSQAAPIPLLFLELKFLELIERSQKKHGGGSSTPPPAGSRSVRNTTPSDPEEDEEDEASVAPAEKIELKSAAVAVPERKHSPILKPETVPRSGVQADGTALCERWAEFVKLAAEHNFGLATLLNSAQPLAGSLGHLKLSVYYRFHQEQLLQPKFLTALQDMCNLFIGGYIELECVLATEPATAELRDVPPSDTLTELAVASLM